MTYTNSLMSEMPSMTRKVLPSDTIELALFLLGKLVVRVLPSGMVGGRIVETEAYPIGDPAAHAYRKMTVRNKSLFLDRGYAYVYRAYGVSFMLNVASEKAGQGAGVLVRSLEPEFGICLMRQNQVCGIDRNLTRGPGRLAKSFSIDKSLDGNDLCAPGPLYLAAATRPVGQVGVSSRIGISRAIDAPWRFFLRGNGFVSGTRRLNA